MTVSESLIIWLNENESLEFDDIDTDILKSEDGSYSVLKSPNNTEIEYIDGSKLVTEYYEFLANQSVLEESKRVSNQQALSDLENWIRERDYEEDYPKLDFGEVTEIKVTSSATITSLEEDDKAIYQIIISIQYLRER